MSENNNKHLFPEGNYNKKLGLFNWQIKEAFEMWKFKNKIKELFGIELDL